MSDSPALASGDGQQQIGDATAIPQPTADGVDSTHQTELAIVGQTDVNAIAATSDHTQNDVPAEQALPAEGVSDATSANTVEPMADVSAVAPAPDAGADRVEKKESASEEEDDSSESESESSDDDSSSSSSDATPQKARKAFNDFDGSDDEPSAPPRTKNEVLTVPVVVETVVLDDNAVLFDLGVVSQVSGTNVIVMSNIGTKALNEDSLLCLPNKQVIGKIDEVFGPVSRPYYVVRFATEAAASTFKEHEGAAVSFVQSKSSFVLTSAIKDKGSDASNAHDEEPAAEDVEYSDDEKEAEAKRALKKRRRGEPASPGHSDGEAPEEAAGSGSDGEADDVAKMGHVIPPGPSRGRGRGRGGGFAGRGRQPQPVPAGPAPGPPHFPPPHSMPYPQQPYGFGMPYGMYAAPPAPQPAFNTVWPPVPGAYYPSLGRGTPSPYTPQPPAHPQHAPLPAQPHYAQPPQTVNFFFPPPPMSMPHNPHGRGRGHPQ